jgi:1-acyl-sn-glycerol-3-phosphate acyltransferase
MHDRPLAALRLTALVLWTLLLLAPALLAWWLRRRIPPALARLWHGGCCWIAGLEVKVVGTPDPGPRLLYVANHVSYLDIIALGSQLDAAFIAKAEVSAWPAIGLIARLGRTVFVQRRATQCGRECRTLASRLTADERLILFAEGTSSDGTRVLPFKSALFGALEQRGTNHPVMIQPVTIAYRRFRGGLALARSFRSCYAWYGDMALVPHLWSVLGLPGAEVELRFHDPLPATAFTSRKALAAHAQHQVATGLEDFRAAA